MYDSIICFLHYIFTYIQHNGDVSLENYSSKFNFKMSGDKTKKDNLNISVLIAYVHVHFKYSENCSKFR